MKPDLRRKARRGRRRAHRLFGRQAAKRAARQLLARVPLPPGQIVALYWPFGSEIDPRPLIAPLARRRRMIVALPVVVAEGKPLIFRRLRKGARLFPSPRGMKAPGGIERAVRPDLVLVPLLAYDPAGNRLGSGAGFYDRTLDRLRATGRVVAIGYAFGAQAVATLPEERFDQKLDWMVTEARVRKIR